MSKFSLGRVVATPGALEALQEAQTTIHKLLRRHLSGDWGDVGEDDWRTNDDDLQAGGRLLSVYKLSSGSKIYVITERDRSVTTMLLAEEY